MSPDESVQESPHLSPPATLGPGRIPKVCFQSTDAAAFFFFLGSWSLRTHMLPATTKAPGVNLSSGIVAVIQSTSPLRGFASSNDSKTSCLPSTLA